MASQNDIILPGATLGLLGSGQLGRMFALAARRMGYRVEVYSPDRDSPAGQVADREWIGEYTNSQLLREFAQRVAVVTLEFENIDVAAVRTIDALVPVRPGAHTLHIAQHRTREKTTLQGLGLPTAPFRVVRSAADLQQGLEDFGEGILKTAASGYDGKGQQRVRVTEDPEQIWQSFRTDEAVLEGIVRFQCEFSVIGVRGAAGEFTAYDPILNTHSNHILDVSESPAAVISKEVAHAAREMTRKIMTSLGTVGVLCVEFFLTEAGTPVINEVAPRPHNSGHLTIEAHECCQFEQQVRAVCGLPLGSTRQRQPAVMVNLLGDLWPADGEPDWEQALAQPGVKLHLYGKAEPRAGRKMGHLTVAAPAVAEARSSALLARELLARTGSGAE